MRRRTAFLTLAGLSLISTPAFATDPYTFIVIPDSQNYTNGATPNVTYNIGDMNWIVANQSALNIKFVMHLGDFQNPGNPYRTRTDDIYEPDLSRPVGDVNDKLTKWDRADAAIDVLDNAGIPYSLVPGNHDYLNADTKIEPYKYLKEFGPSRYTNNPKYDELGNLTYQGASPSTPTFAWAGVSTYHKFYAGGYTWLNIALQDIPDANDLAWAQTIINQNPNMPTIITTHEYVGTNGYQHPEIWNTFVKNNPQIVMTFNGHLDGTNRIADTNIAGKTVQGMLVDYQNTQFDTQFGADYYVGAGVIRTIQVDPNTNKVNVKSYSPVANQYATDAGNQFSFTLNLEDRFGLPDKGGTTGSVTFRDGLNGYTSTRDSMISQANPSTNYGTDTSAVVDADNDGEPSQGVVRFDSIFGTTGIPAGAQIDHAELRLHTSDQTNAQSNNTFRLYRLLKPWAETGITWNAMTDGFQIDGLEAILGENGAVVPDVQDGYVTFDVTESLAAWAAGAPNNGWVIIDGGTNAWRWDTREASASGDRPRLVVDYRTDTVGPVPEPTTLALLLPATFLLTPRRPRRGA